MKLTLKIAVLLILVSAGLQTVRGYMGVADRLEEIEKNWRSDQELLARAIIPAVTRAERLEGEAAARYTLTYLAQAQAHREARWVELDANAEMERRPRVDLTKIRLSGVEDIQSIVEVGTDGARYLYTYALIPSDVTEETIGTLELARRLPSTSKLSQAIVYKELHVILAFVAVATVLVLFLGIWFVGRPVSTLAAHADAVGRGDLDARVAIRSRDELGHLAKTMNQMAGRLKEARKRADEEQLAREEALEQMRHAERLATVGQLAAGIAHEVGTPLSVIRGRATILNESASLPDDAKRHAQIVITQVDRIAKIVHGLLDFARQSDAERSDIDLCGLLEVCADLLRVEARTKSVQLQLDVPDAPVLAHIDEGQIQQVVMNLLVNAIHASDGGSITLGCKRTTKSEVCLWVEDAGSGMANEVCERIFEPFFTTKDVGEGTGLGLAVSYGIVQEHGGRITVQSELGKGTRFGVVLPAAVPPSEPAAVT